MTLSLKELVTRKPGNDSQVLAEQAKNGLTALETILSDRDRAINEVHAQRAIIDKLVMENEGLRQANADLIYQRDFWMRSNAQFEALLGQLGATMQNMMHLVHRQPQAQQTSDLKQIAEKFSPDTGKVKNAKSVG